MAVLRVDERRWRQAQRAELALWTSWAQGRGWRRLAWPLVRPLLAASGIDRGAGDDWNRWWAAQFDYYAFLPTELGDVIELGCGPFTNVRHILRERSARRVVCSDPLADAYVGFRGRWLADAYRAGRVEVDNHPIEELPFEVGTFDLVVMINVLDHVRDAELCLRTAVDLVRPGGILVLGQDLTGPAAGGNIADDDVYHPIKLALTDVAPHLEGLEALWNKELPRKEGRSPYAHDATLIFAGRKPA